MKIKFLCILTALFCIINLLPISTGDGSLSVSVKGPVSVSAAYQQEPVRGVWAATVYALDYPSRYTTSEALLKQDVENLLNNVQSLGYNTLFFQVRPASDAFYQSNIFPWSKYLTGTPGQAPENGFDPLRYITEEAHKRGIAVHAWINPYRVTAAATDNNNLAWNSVAKQYPDLVVQHTDGKLYLNPGEPAANQLVVDGVMEIVRNYNIDGIHLDDYFYPKGNFPDGETFSKYRDAYNDLGDWRRNNVTTLIAMIDSSIKAEKPDVVFSVSPAGIWANKASNSFGSNTNGSQTFYDSFADTRLWVQAGIVDWIMPQLYWNIGYSIADFETLANWWADVTAGTDVKLCVGQGVYRVTEETKPTSAWYGSNGHNELRNQDALLRALGNYNGYAHYRLGTTLQSPELSEVIRDINAQNANLAQTPSNPQEAPLFWDLPQYQWAQEAIVALNQKGIVNGMDDGSFGCSRKITRADFTIMLVRMLGADSKVISNFEDISPDKYYYHEIGVAKAIGITTGRDGKIFDPAANISREDMATMVYRILSNYGKLNYDESFNLSDKFPDATSIADYAKTPVAAMCSMSLLSGYDTGEFLPKGLATRAEAAVFLNRVFKIFE